MFLGLIVLNPTPLFHGKPYMTIEEVQALIDTPMPHEEYEIVKCAYLFSCFCGLRISDIIIEKLTMAKAMIRNDKIVIFFIFIEYQNNTYDYLPGVKT